MRSKSSRHLHPVNKFGVCNAYLLMIWSIVSWVSYQISPYFLTTLPSYQTGNQVLTLSPASTSSNLDASSTSFSYQTSLSGSSVSMGVGLSYMSSLYSTTTAQTYWMYNISITSVGPSSATLLCTRNASVFSQFAINYIVVLQSFWLQISTTTFDLSNSTLNSVTSSFSRTTTYNINYRTKSNSSNAVAIINLAGLSSSRKLNTYQHSITVSNKQSSNFQITVSVSPYNGISSISVCAISYESVAQPILPPYYIDYGYITDFSGAIADSSGISSISSYGTMFTGMLYWQLVDSSGYNTYNFNVSAGSYSLASQSVQSHSTSYMYYRQLACPQYYFLNSADNTCVSCHYTCLTCYSSTNTSCLTCSSTRQFTSLNSSCGCLTGYIDQGAPDCTQITCDDSLVCLTCVYINQCGSCPSYLNRVLVNYTCVCKPYTYSNYEPINKNVFCSPCHYSCYTCNPSSLSTDCLSCNSSRDLRTHVASNGTCSCLSSYFDNNTVICAKCQYSCATCSSLSACVSCNSTMGRIFDSNGKYCICVNGMYDNKIVQQCDTCGYTCLTCNSSSSCLSCPSTRSLANTTTANNQCLCIAGFYDNYVSPDCLPCHYTCYTCINPLTCYSCSSAMHRQYNNVTQLCTCTTGYYDDTVNQLCADCNVMCMSCTNGAETGCTSCYTAAYNRVLAVNGSCICMDKYYQVDAFTVGCAGCYYTCKTCTNSVQCTSCDSTKHRLPSATNSSQCVCMGGYFDTGNQLCTKCIYYCLTCTNSTNLCLTCDAATRYPGNCTCLPGYYDDGISSACQPCLPQCVTCSNGVNCTTCTAVIKQLTSSAHCACSNGYLEPACTPCAYSCQTCITQADNCVLCDGSKYRYYYNNGSSGKGECLCYTGYYDDGTSMLCQSCHYSCLTCTSRSSCTSCPSSRVFDTSNIYCVCSSQMYQNSTSLSCSACHYSCANCSAIDVCTSCNTVSMYRIPDNLYNTSLCICSNGYYSDGTHELCLPCNSKCSTCSSYTLCTACNLTTTFRVLDTNTSTCICTFGYYESTIDNLCHICHPSCVSCNNGISCLTCKTNRVIDANNLLCVCIDGYFQNTTTLTCEPCVYPCTKCVSSSLTCTACESTHLILVSSNSCYCPPKTVENGTNCQSCLPTCLTCANSVLYCTYCIASQNRQLQQVGATSTEQLCVCIQGYHDENGTLHTCTTCNYTCLTCTNSQSCINCKDIRILNVTNSITTFCICPGERFYDDGSNPTCLPCLYSCLSCDKLSSNCTSCSSSAFRYLSLTDPGINSSSCLCKSGYYNDPSNTLQVCQTCYYSCATCTNSSSCATCNSTLHRVANILLSSYCVCSTGYYDVTNIQTCQPCSYTCQTCSLSPTHCLSCISTRNYSSTSYSCPCNDGLFDDIVSSNPICQACLYLCATCADITSCLSCPNTRTSNSSNLCACNSSYYDTGNSLQCLKCSPYCKECTNYQTCITCNTTQLRIISSSSCICPPGYYDPSIAFPSATPLDYVCASCHYSCQRCQNNNSCSSCDSNMFRTRNPLTGFCKCISGYYDDTINSNQLCQLCLFDCLTCADGVSCLTCPSDRQLDTTSSPNRCKCLSQYYSNNTLCQSCPPECASCTSLSQCTACNNPTQRILVNGSCLCDAHLYPVANTALCQPCLYSCNSCVSYPYCSSCLLTQHRYLSTKQCLCISAYYDDMANNMLCQPCHYSCQTCTNFTACLTCDSTVSNRIYDPLTNYCICKPAYYQNTTLKLCMSCDYTCLTCSSATSCSSCSPISYRTLNTTVPSAYTCQCPTIGYFDKPLVAICVACSPTCYTCALASTHCTDCDTAVTFRTLASNNTCMCNSGYYESSTLTVICSACSKTCLTCTSISTQCTSCSISDNRNATSILTNTAYACPCNAGYYDDGFSAACKLCDYRCQTCLNSYQCTTCDEPNHHRSLELISEMCYCMDRFYQPALASNTSDPVCQPCHYTCLTCVHSTLCLSCDTTNATRYPSNGQCLCNIGFYDNSTYILCLPCHYTCLSCLVGNACSACNAVYNRVYNASSSLCSCVRRYYDVGDGVDANCLPCHSSCYSCTNSTSCENCYPLINKYVNQSMGSSYCVCYYGYYLPTASNSITGTCLKCHYSCETCTASSTSCTSCDLTARRNLTSGASCPCLTGYYDDGTNQLCLACIQYCVLCFGSNLGQCLQCQNNTYLLGGICLVSCPTYYYPVTSNWQCKSCSSYCTACVDNTMCTTCQASTYLIQYSILHNTANTANPNNSYIVCTPSCPQFYYHNATHCLPCLSPCLHCTSEFTCIDCVLSFYLEASVATCFPCYKTCRACRDSSALGCITCIDGYYFNTTAGLCQKIVCSPGYYVNSISGCVRCSDTYPNSKLCNAYTLTSCNSGFMLLYDNSTNTNICAPCSNSLLLGYRYDSLSNSCIEVCGDNIHYTQSCDDGNNLNGDGCSSICNIEQGWDCTALNNISNSLCALNTNLQLTIKAESLKKIMNQNKIRVVLSLNIGLRLVKENYILRFNSGQKFDYTVIALNSVYTRYQIDIEYYETVAKDKLNIVVKSPIARRLLFEDDQQQQPSLMPSLLLSQQKYQLAQRVLQSAVALNISLSLSLQLQIQTFPAAVYYKQKSRTMYSFIFFICLICLHVVSLLVFLYFALYLKLKVMLFSIQYLNFITLLYIYSTYGLYQISELAAESARALQHFIYKFGQDLDAKYSDTNIAYFGFGSFMIAGCIIQLVILAICTVAKVYYNSELVSRNTSNNNYVQIDSKQSQKQQAEKDKLIRHRASISKYYHTSLTFIFLPQLVLCSIVVVAWVDPRNSLQTAYSWGTMLIVIIMIALTNWQYIRQAHVYCRIYDKSRRQGDLQEYMLQLQAKNNLNTNANTNLNTTNPKNANNTTTNIFEMQQPSQDHHNNVFTVEEAMELPFDPFAEQAEQKNIINNANKEYEELYNTIRNNKNNPAQNSNNNLTSTKLHLWDEENKTQINSNNSNGGRNRGLLKSGARNKNIYGSQVSSQHTDERSQSSKQSQSTTMSKLKRDRLVTLYDLTPIEIPFQNASLYISNIYIPYNRLFLHYLYLPLKCTLLSLLVCIAAQIQQPIARNSLLIVFQISSLIYIIITMRFKNTRTFKLLFLAFILLSVSVCGLVELLLIKLSTQQYLYNYMINYVNGPFIIQCVIIGLIILGLVGNIVFYVFQVLRGEQYRRYKIEMRNKQIIQRNIRRNRLRNIKQFGIQSDIMKMGNIENKTKGNINYNISAVKLQGAGMEDNSPTSSNIFNNLRNPNDSYKQEVYRDGDVYDRYDTRQHLRLDSEQLQTPNQYNNIASTHILMGIKDNIELGDKQKQNKKIKSKGNRVEIQDVDYLQVQKIQIQEGEEHSAANTINRKLKGALSKNLKNNGNAGNNNHNNTNTPSPLLSLSLDESHIKHSPQQNQKKGKLKQLPIYSVGQIQPSSHNNLQQTRAINSSNNQSKLTHHHEKLLDSKVLTDKYHALAMEKGKPNQTQKLKFLSNQDKQVKQIINGRQKSKAQQQDIKNKKSKGRIEHGKQGKDEDKNRQILQYDVQMKEQQVQRVSKQNTKQQRKNSYMLKLQQQLIGNNNDTTIIISHEYTKHKNKSKKQQQKDNTLISYKQSDKEQQRYRKKKQPSTNQNKAGIIDQALRDDQQQQKVRVKSRISSLLIDSLEEEMDERTYKQRNKNKAKKIKSQSQQQLKQRSKTSNMPRLDLKKKANQDKISNKRASHSIRNHNIIKDLVPTRQHEQDPSFVSAADNNSEQDNQFIQEKYVAQRKQTRKKIQEMEEQLQWQLQQHKQTNLQNQKVENDNIQQGLAIDGIKIVAAPKGKKKNPNITNINPKRYQYNLKGKNNKQTSVPKQKPKLQKVTSLIEQILSKNQIEIGEQKIVEAKPVKDKVKQVSKDKSKSKSKDKSKQKGVKIKRALTNPQQLITVKVNQNQNQNENCKNIFESNQGEYDQFINDDEDDQRIERLIQNRKDEIIKRAQQHTINIEDIQIQKQRKIEEERENEKDLSLSANKKIEEQQFIQKDLMQPQRQKQLRPKKQKQKIPKVFKQKNKNTNPLKLNRIQSISSIDDNEETNEIQTNKQAEQSDQEQEEQNEAQGMTVFKKILHDYQIYKAKKGRKGKLLKH